MPPSHCADLAFPGAPACQDYTGDGWNIDSAATDCQTSIPGSEGAGTPVVGTYCDPTGIVGTCTIHAGTIDEKQLHFYAGEPATLEPSCVNYLGGVWSLVVNPSCVYEQPGAPGTPNLSVCSDYVGDGWSQNTAQDDCAGKLNGVFGATPCAKSTIGYCNVAQGMANETDIHFYDGDAAELEMACTIYMRGAWTSTEFAGACRTMMPFGPPPSAPMVSICKQYDGLGFDAAAAQADCASSYGAFLPGQECPDELALGFCAQNAGTDDQYGIHFYEDNELGWNAIQFRDTCVAAFPRGLGGSWSFAADLPMEVIEALVGDADVAIAPDACLTDNCIDTLAANDEAIIFQPAAMSASRGLIIYPGTAIEPRAYAVAARAIASYGFFVALVPFPGNLAITDPMRAEHIVMAHPEILDWAIAGHSLGGVAASIFASYAEGVPFVPAMDGIAFWASYPAPAMGPTSPAADLSGTDIKGVTITADLDDVIIWDNYESTRGLLPPATYEVEIRGGNHGQFGYYGAQNGDNPAEISREHQHDLFVGATVHMLNRIGVSDEADAIDPIYSNMDTKAEDFCARGQKRIAQIPGSVVKRKKIEEVVYPSFSEFQASKPSFPDAGSDIEVTSHSGQTPNPLDITAPPVLDGERYCKMKTQEAIAEEFNWKPKDPELQCSELASKALVDALKILGLKSDADCYFDAITFTADTVTGSGPEWLGSRTHVAELDDGTFEVQSTALWTPMFMPPGLEQYAGNYYCKTWSVEAAVNLILSAGIVCEQPNCPHRKPHCARHCHKHGNKRCKHKSKEPKHPHR